MLLWLSSSLLSSSSLINGHALCKRLSSCWCICAVSSHSQTSFNQFCCFPPSSRTQFFSRLYLLFSFVDGKSACFSVDKRVPLCPHIYKSSFMCLQQEEICCHMNLWHRAIRKAGKVNKEDLHYHKPWYLKSIHQNLPASFAINHSSDSSQWRLS